jgi:hypothetical protein
MTNRNIHLLAVLFLTFASGCASMAHGTRETIEANSDPTGADVAIDCGGQRVASGVTPTRLTMRRKLEGCEARFSKEGFAEARLPMQRGFSHSYWGNLGLSMGFPAGIILVISDGVLSTAHEGEEEALLSVGLAGAAGLIVDRVNGAMYDHPANLTARLRPQSQPAPTPGVR